MKDDDTVVKPLARAPVWFIIFTVTLDAMGIGLIMPVMPDLIREIQGTSISNAAYWGGLLSFSYAAMQFLFGPLIGNLSDSFGRRPILITSLVFMALNYSLMAIAPTLMFLFIARVLSGISGATYSTATAYLADTSKRGKRAANFGLMGAAFGVGFILGPVMGGLLGEFGTRIPFIVAAGLALLNAGFGFLVVPETLPAEKRRKFELWRADPFRALLRVKNIPAVGSLMIVVLFYTIANQVYPSIWSYFTIEKFAWKLSTVGISLAAYGLCSALAQVYVLRYSLRRFGEENTARFGMTVAIASLAFIMFVDNSLYLFLGMPFVALGAIVGPSLQGMMADRVADNEQGELQGVLSSVTAIATIVSPLIMTNIFRHYTQAEAKIYLPGAPFGAAAILALVGLIILYRSHHERKG